MRLFFALLIITAASMFAQTSNDLFVMGGTDFVRPGLETRVNLNIGYGHTFDFLKKSPVGDEITVSYTYENAGNHGFFHTVDGSHTESIGLMKNIALPKTKKVSLYTWPQIGITSLTGLKHVDNRLYGGLGLGAIVHLSKNNSIWIQEALNKVATLPVYTTTSVGYTRSW